MVRIERAGMDGSDRQVVVNSSLGWPGALTVDTVSNRIYWTDERLQAIGSATVDGSDLQVVVYFCFCFFFSWPTLVVEATGSLNQSLLSDPADKRDGQPLLSSCIQRELVLVRHEEAGGALGSQGFWEEPTGSSKAAEAAVCCEGEWADEDEDSGVQVHGGATYLADHSSSAPDGS